MGQQARDRDGLTRSDDDPTSLAAVEEGVREASDGVALGLGTQRPHGEHLERIIELCTPEEKEGREEPSLAACRVFPRRKTMPAGAKVPRMNVALRQPMTVEEFLEWEERQELRYEFDGFQPIAMAGASRTHNRIQRNLTIAVGGRLLDGPCEFLGSDFKLRVDVQVRYPDGMVFCTRGTGIDTSARDPVVVFEVLSKSTADTDRFTKVREYQSLPSVLRYVLLEQEKVAATVLVRAGDVWLSHILIGDERLSMPEIGLEFPLSELYRGVDFDDAGVEEMAR